MTLTSVDKDPETRTMTFTAQFDAPVARVWQVWSDPRQLERWWGPPTYPATVVDHDLTPGGSVTYLMTGPEGDKHRGWWRVQAVDAPHRLEFEDGFADHAGNPNADLPTTTVRVTLREQAGGGTRMEIASTFPSLEAMEQLIAMGMEEGMAAAIGQIDQLLAPQGR
ncbi:SRPBCC family protein [Pseudonocardia sp. T1-2H]|uniref:SRPBCC family protein n=1 Tax=Pseudonocardia sp. T1-2H TaxID=3128899 RepID=UPI003101208D